MRRLGVAAATLGVVAACGAFDAASDSTPATTVQTHDAGGSVDGSTTTAIPPDAATTETDSAAPSAHPQCPTNAIFCDDFESGNLAKWLSVSEDPSASVTVAVDANNNHVLHADTPGTVHDTGLVQAYANATMAVQPYPGTIAFRGLVKLPANLSDNQHIFQLMGTRDTGVDEPGPFFVVSVIPFATKWRVETTNQIGTTTHDDPGGVVLPKLGGDYMCVELDVVLADPSGNVRLYVDGQRVVDATARTYVFGSGDYDKLFFRAGFFSDHGGVPQDLMFDDVAVIKSDAQSPSDTALIGCSP